MLVAPLPRPLPELPRPPVTPRERTQLEAFLVLRRNPLELWGPAAYREEILWGRFLGREQIMINAPDAIRHVLVTNHENYGRNIGTVRVLQPVLGAGLVLAEGEAWRHHRRTMAPALAPRTMPVLARHVVLAAEETEAALGRAAGGRPVDLLRHMQTLALTIAGRSMFSLEMAAFGDELRAMLLRYALAYARPGFLDLLLPGSVRSPLDVGRAAFRKEWLRFIDRLIEARERQAEKAPADRPRDLFDLLAAARDPETGAGFNRAQLRDEVATLIIAGHETTAATLFWACYAAARLPEHQERIAAEAAALDLSPENAAAALKRLPYTRAHLDETLRLYPPAFLIVREALGPDTIGARRIAAGTVVSISPWVLHRHRRRWANADAFDPNRFLPGAPAPERFAYMPFGAGPRVCIGAQFALTEATLVLARLLRAFRIEPFGSGTVVPRGFVTTQPDRPIRFLLSRRGC
ncbi:MAG: cytochrome P450 [Acetobacteraceae bacterium]|nr:cytochrome P450 [Acetobacteraceae bacterium]